MRTEQTSRGFHQARQLNSRAILSRGDERSHLGFGGGQVPDGRVQNLHLRPPRRGVGYPRVVGVEQPHLQQQRRLAHPATASVQHLPRPRHGAELPADARQHLPPALRSHRRSFFSPGVAPLPTARRWVRHGGRRVQARAQALEAHAHTGGVGRPSQPRVRVLRLLRLRQLVHAEQTARMQRLEHHLFPAARG